MVIRMQGKIILQQISFNHNCFKIPKEIKSACFAIAGPVKGDNCKLTNYFKVNNFHKIL